MTVWMRRGLAGMGFLAALWGGQRALAALPPPEEPAGSTASSWVARTRSEEARVKALQAAVMRAEAANRTLTRETQDQEASLSRQTRTLGQVEAVLASDQERLQAAQAASSVTAAVPAAPSVHTTTGASGGGDDGHGRDDQAGGDD